MHYVFSSSIKNGHQGYMNPPTVMESNGDDEDIDHTCAVRCFGCD